MTNWLDRIRNSSLTRYLTVFIGMALSLGIAGMLYVRREQLISLVDVTPRWFALLLVLQFGYLFFQSMAHHAVVRGFGINLELGESYGLTVLNNLFNLFIPARGGAVVRSGYMKARHGLRVRDCIQGMTYMGFLGLLTIGGMGLAGSVVIGAGPWILALFTGVGLLGALTLVSPPLIRRLLHRWDRFNLDPRTWKRVSGVKVVLPVLTGYLGMAMTYGLRIHVALLAVGYSVSLSVSMFSGLVVMAVAALPFVPGSIGVQESLMGSVMGLMGVPVSVVLAAALVERLSQVLFLIGPSIYYYVRLIVPLDRSDQRGSEDQRSISHFVSNGSTHILVRTRECFRWIF